MTSNPENSETEIISPSNNHNLPIELQVVHGSESGAFSQTLIDMRLSEDMSYDQWREVLRMIRQTWKKASIYMADCLSYGIKKWGRQKVDDALEQLELEVSLIKPALVITAVPVQMRFENLTGDHYVELIRSGIPKAQKIKWAKIASDQRLTPSQLRYSIAEGEVVDRAATKMLQTGVITVQGIRQSFEIWLRRVHGIEGVKKMDLEDQIEIMEELDAICEFGMLLHDHLVATGNIEEEAPASST
jgi:hypothetical protein